MTADILDQLKQLAEKSFQTLTPLETDKEKCSATLHLNSYVELHLLIINLLKVATAALDAEQHDITTVENTAFAVKNILELTTQLIPLEEAYLLDEIRGGFRGLGGRFRA